MEGGAEGDHWVVSVHEHKAAASLGPANIVLNEYLYSTMARYLEFRKGKGPEMKFLINSYEPRGSPISSRDWGSLLGHERLNSPNGKKKKSRDSCPTR